MLVDAYRRWSLVSFTSEILRMSGGSMVKHASTHDGDTLVL